MRKTRCTLLYVYIRMHVVSPSKNEMQHLLRWLMRLRDKISTGKRPVVVYEILPPRIIDGTIDHALLLELFTDSGIGTMIKRT